MMIRRRTLLMMGIALLFTGFGVFSFLASAQSQTPPMVRGPFMLAGGDKMMIWRIDQATGKVSYCMRDSISTDPKFIVSRPPYCSSWSE